MINLAQNSNIRRIDELGRIVIPKDIRKKLHIKDSEPLEIYIEGDEIRIKKYSSLPDLEEYVRFLMDTGSRITNNEYMLTTREEVLLATEEKYIKTPLDAELKNLVFSCTEQKNEYIDFRLGNESLQGKANIIPIIIDNDRSGLLIEYNTTKDISNDNAIKIFANLIQKQLNNY